MSALTDLLERHIPYASTLRDDLLCLVCINPTEDVDSRRCGEFPDAAAWAAHVANELQQAGLVVSRRLATAAEQTEAMF